MAFISWQAITTFEVSINDTEAVALDSARRTQIAQHRLRKARRLALIDERSRCSVPRSIRLPPLVVEFISTFHGPVTQDSWFSLVPCRLNQHDAAIDAAARALILARRSKSSYDPGHASRCISAYAHAIQLLRCSLDTSDASLLASTLLCAYEMLTRDALQSYFSHFGGVSSILLSRPRESPASETTRALYYWNYFSSFRTPLVLGIASPFDDPYWLNLEPYSSNGALPENIRRLRKLGMQMSTRLPGLIAKVRRLRESHCADLVDYQSDEYELAAELLALQDGDSESELLHCCRVAATKDQEFRALVPYSTTFPSLYETETLARYWLARLLVVRLCLKLDNLRCKLNEADSASFSFDSVLLRTEQERLLMSILMCYENGFDRDRMGLSKSRQLPQIWSCLMDMQTFRGKPVEPLRDWVFAECRENVLSWGIALTREELDVTGDIFVGGELKGYLVQTQPEKARRV